VSVIRSGVTVQFGLLSITTSVLGAVIPEPTNRTVCEGAKGMPAHDPTRISMPLTCPHCKVISAEDTKKAREVGDDLVVIDEAALAKIKDSTPFQRTMTLRPHPASQVDLGTVSDGKVYYLEPKAGSERAYAVLAAFLGAHDDLAFCTQWAPRSKVGMFRLAVVTPKGGNPVLAMHGRMAANRLREAPELPVEADPNLVEMLEKALRIGRKSLVTSFIVDDYMDDAEEQIAALLALSTPARHSKDSTVAALEEMLKAARKPRAPRKPKVQPLSLVEGTGEPTTQPSTQPSTQPTTKDGDAASDAA
jgi:non-homologous end joining protein Ku